MTIPSPTTTSHNAHAKRGFAGVHMGHRQDRKNRLSSPLAAREPQLLNIPLPLPSVPILTPVLETLLGPQGEDRGDGGGDNGGGGNGGGGNGGGGNGGNGDNQTPPPPPPPPAPPRPSDPEPSANPGNGSGSNPGNGGGGGNPGNGGGGSNPGNGGGGSIPGNGGGGSNDDAGPAPGAGNNGNGNGGNGNSGSGGGNGNGSSGGSGSGSNEGSGSESGSGDDQDKSGGSDSGSGSGRGNDRPSNHNNGNNLVTNPGNGDSNESDNSNDNEGSNEGNSNGNNPGSVPSSGSSSPTGAPIPPSGSPTQNGGPTLPDGSERPSDEAGAASSGGLSTGAIAGIAIAFALLLSLCCLILARRRHRKRRADRQHAWWARKFDFGTGASEKGSLRSRDADIASGRATSDTRSVRSSFGTNVDAGLLPDFSNNYNQGGRVSWGPMPEMPPMAQIKMLTGSGNAAHTNGSAANAAGDGAAIASPVTPLVYIDDDTNRRHSASSIGSTASDRNAYLGLPTPIIPSTNTNTANVNYSSYSPVQRLSSQAIADANAYGRINQAGVAASPMSVRPFSPTERFNFPKPPHAEEKQPSQPSSPLHVQVETIRQTVASPDMAGSSSAPMNPFDDANSATGHSNSSHASTSTREPHIIHGTHPYAAGYAPSPSPTPSGQTTYTTAGSRLSVGTMGTMGTVDTMLAPPSTPVISGPTIAAGVRTSSASSISSASIASGAAPALGHGERIRRPFVPTLGDEVAVNTGDLVDVKQVFDDGWAYVAVSRAGASQPSMGLIPVDCFREANEELPAFLAAKRVSSYKGPLQAQ